MKYSKITLDKKDGPITDFAAERNGLLERAKTDWVFFVDSDERVSPELKREIQGVLDVQGFQGYYVKRRDFFFGKWLRFGETGNIKLLRLGRKDAGQWRRKVHEVWEMRPHSAKASRGEDIGELRGELRHYPHKTISDFIKSINHYTDLDAEEFGKLSYFDLLKPAGKFLQNYFLKFGFLDGTAGFIHAFMMSFQSLVTRVKQDDFFQNFSTTG